ncbi:hypothetical protein M0804_015419 [Polistes exclamans]|nr:hypothetical protein M0804_015419 [Polistes exclamans]
MVFWEPSSYNQSLLPLIILVDVSNFAKSYCYVANTEAKEGYIPRLRLPPGVYAAEALVKNENGKAYFKVINTTSKPVSLVIQRLELFDCSLADGTDDLDVTLPATADAKITETDNEYSDVESASDSADYDKLFSPYTPTRVGMRSRMITESIFETRDSLHLRRDNLIVFTDLSGTPCDDGAKILNKAKQLPKSEHLVLARAGVTNIGKYKLVIIPIKERAENSTKFETLVEAIGALLSVTRELGLRSVNLVHKIRCSQVMARQNLVGAKIRSKVYYDRKARGQNLIVGQSVYVLKQPTSKLGNQYTGPHQILEVLPKNNIKISYKNWTRIVHKDKVKICAK